MKCQLCSKPHTYNMNCKACTVRWLKTLPDWYKRQWLKDYRAKHGAEKMREIINEILELQEKQENEFGNGGGK